jgi:hypothetical protein
MPESKAEIYLQFGKNDFPWNIRDAIGEPEHSRAYVAGGRKLIQLGKNNAYIEFGLEVAQLEGANTGIFREQPVWYLHSLLPAGYTNEGQLLGAGIGTEGNQQTVELNWVNGLKKIGLRIENTINNRSLATTINGKRKDWTDLSFAGNYDSTYKNFVLSSQLVYIKSRNFQYRNYSASNFHLQIGLLYNL